MVSRPPPLLRQSAEVTVPCLVAIDEVGEVGRAGKRRPFGVVAVTASSDEVVEPVIAAMAPRDEVVDLSSGADALAAVEAPAKLQVEESLGNALQGDAVATEEEVLEL